MLFGDYGDTAIGMFSQRFEIVDLMSSDPNVHVFSSSIDAGAALGLPA
jgi:hypothetical protein